MADSSTPDLHDERRSTAAQEVKQANLPLVERFKLMAMDITGTGVQRFSVSS
jgi:hypothetical protein